MFARRRETTSVAWRWLRQRDGTWVPVGVAADGRALLAGHDEPFHPRRVGLVWGPTITPPVASVVGPMPGDGGIYWYRMGDDIVLLELHDGLAYAHGVAGATVAADLPARWGPRLDEDEHAKRMGA